MQTYLPAERSAYSLSTISTRVPDAVLAVVDELARKKKRSRSDVFRDLLFRRLLQMNLIVLANDGDYLI